MRGVNKVILVGNLGNDPETRSFPDGGAITNISIATSESWKDRQTGQQQERTEWHRVTFRGRLAEVAAQYLKKGSKVYIEGSLQTRKWQDKATGQDRYSTEINAREMQMLDSRGEGMGQENGGYNQVPQQQVAPVQNFQQQAPMQAPQQQVPQQQVPQQQAPQQPSGNQPVPQAAPASFDDFDDDIPF